MARCNAKAGASASRLIPHARRAAITSRNRAIAVAYGFRSTPAIWSRHRCASTGAVVAGSRSRHEREQTLERPDEEVTGAARRVDEPHLVEAELVDRRRERAVQDEPLDELRRLQERVSLLGGL